MRLLFDIESDGLLDTISRIWCIATIDLDSGEEHLYRPNEVCCGIEQLLRADELVGHNIVGYDIPAVERMFGVSMPTTQVHTDTLTLSRMVYTNLAELDYGVAPSKARLPAKLTGSHSLEAWGYRLGCGKIEFSDFSQYTEEMGTYCLQDTRLNLKLYRHLMSPTRSKGVPVPPRAALDLEQTIKVICDRQEAHGVPYDVLGGQRLHSMLSAKLEEVTQHLQQIFEPTVVHMKTKTKTIPFNPGSRQQIADRLIKRGWEPEGRTDTGQVKVDESTLETAQHIQGVDKLLEYFLLEKRVGAVENWNKAVTPKGLIHGRVDTLGTGTHRCSHSKPNLAQVPSNGSPYGKDCRALFYAPDGFDMLGCDVSRLELMMLAHYMDDPAFSEVLLTGDVHTLLAESYGVPRGPGKNVTYAMIYGAGLEKLGVTADPSLGTKALRVARGKAIMANLEKRLPALPKLQARIKEVAARKKTVTLIDGREIPVRSEHSALNFLLQGGGAVVCKKWVCNFHAVKPASVQQVLYVHDELQMLVPTGMGEEVGHLCVSSITKAGQDLGVKLPLTGEFNVGKTWAETH